jgi:hypothetical protein
VAGCCKEFNQCGEALGEWANFPPGDGCRGQFVCADLCLRERIGDGGVLSDNDLTECVHGCRGWPSDQIPEDVWPLYEPAVKALVECFLSAPTVVRAADDDAGVVWEQVEAPIDEWPGSCFSGCWEARCGSDPGSEGCE